MDARAREAVVGGDGDEVESRPETSRRRRTDAPDSVRVLKPRRAAPADAVRPTRAEVNLAALRQSAWKRVTLQAQVCGRAAAAPARFRIHCAISGAAASDAARAKP